MPKPSQGESEADFVKRCIPMVIDEGTAADGTQAAAICHSLYGNVKDKKPKTYAQTGKLAAMVETVKREMFDGRQHLVVPAVMAVAGVLNGALLTQEALIASADSWNGRPVVVYHPEMMGQAVSVASTPKLFEQRIGFIFNARMDADRLKSDLWIDPERAERLGQSAIIEKIERGEPEEVSTGYIADAVQAAGSFSNVEYTMLHENIRPDHFAILPGQTGACSLKDGCGVPRVNSSCGCDNCKTKAQRLVVDQSSEQTHTDAMRLLALMAILSRQTSQPNLRRF